MIFEYKSKARWYDLSFEDYKNEEILYFTHLINLPFTKQSQVLKYLGASFFHDYRTIATNLKPISKELEIFLSSDNILEDINHYRKLKGLSMIDQRKYWVNPIIVECRFKGVSEYHCNVDFDNNQEIMDTEISSYDKRKGYHIGISFSETEEISFYCRGLRVIEGSQKIEEYTNNKRSTIPYCKGCRQKMLSKSKLEKLIDKA